MDKTIVHRTEATQMCVFSKQHKSKSKTRSSHFKCFASGTTLAKSVFICNPLVAACTALFPIKRQDRPVCLGSVWPSKNPFIAASGEGPI